MIIGRQVDILICHDCFSQFLKNNPCSTGNYSEHTMHDLRAQLIVIITTMMMEHMHAMCMAQSAVGINYSSDTQYWLFFLYLNKWMRMCPHIHENENRQMCLFSHVEVGNRFSFISRPIVVLLLFLDVLVWSLLLVYQQHLKASSSRHENIQNEVLISRKTSFSFDNTTRNILYMRFTQERNKQDFRFEYHASCLMRRVSYRG